MNVSNCTLSSFLLNNSVDDSEEEGNYTYIDLKENYNRCNNLCQGSKYVKISYFYEITKQVKVYYDKNTNKVYDNIPNSKNNDEILSSESYFTDNTIFTTTDAYFTDSEGSDVEFADDENIPQESDLVEAFEMRTFVYEVKTDSLLQYSEEYITNNSQIMNIVSKSYLCLDNLGKGGIYSPENLRKCKNAKYFGNNDTYECTECIKDYSLDDDTKTCKQSIKVSMNLRPGFDNCFVTNIGTYSNLFCNKYWNIFKSYIFLL